MRSLCLTIILLFVLMLPISVTAHSGRTDSDGGHQDNSNGEYHYHHGYPAHDHWDMDGDGIIDCPYSFHDNVETQDDNITEQKAPASSSSYSDTSSSKQEGDKDVPNILYWIIGILVIIVIAMYQTIRNKDEMIAATERRHQLLAKDEEDRVKAGIAALHKALVSKYGDNYLYTISGANEGDYVGTDGYPHSDGALRGVGLDNYTFYLGGPPGTSTKVHRPGCRYARSEYPINAVRLSGSSLHMSCMICSSRKPDTSWVEKYKTHKKFLDKYIDNGPKASYQETPGAKINYRGRP